METGRPATARPISVREHALTASIAHMTLKRRDPAIPLVASGDSVPRRSRNDSFLDQAGTNQQVRLDVVVEVELPGVRPETHRVDLMDALVLDPGLDEVVSEDPAGLEEVVVGFQGCE